MTEPKNEAIEWLRIEPCESFGRWCLEIRIGDTWMNLHTDYRCVVDRMIDRITAAAKFPQPAVTCQQVVACVRECRGRVYQTAQLATCDDIEQAIVTLFASAATPQPNTPSGGLADIADERQRQISVEGWTPEHDNSHDKGEMAMAAACYAAPEPVFTKHISAQGQYSNEEYFYDAWPWSEQWDKRGKHDRRRRLVIAGALIVAELDRLDRQWNREHAQDGTGTGKFNDYPARPLSYSAATPAVEESKLTAIEAREKGVCRICKQPANARLNPGDTFVYNFGREYAHRSCLNAESATPAVGRKTISIPEARQVALDSLAKAEQERAAERIAESPAEVECDCKSCFGKGWVLVCVHPLKSYPTHKQTCETCGGTGRVPAAADVDGVTIDMVPCLETQLAASQQECKRLRGENEALTIRLEVVRGMQQTDSDQATYLFGKCREKDARIAALEAENAELRRKADAWDRLRATSGERSYLRRNMDSLLASAAEGGGT